MVEIRICTQCKEPKEVTEFYWRGLRNNWMSECKACNNERRRVDENKMRTKVMAAYGNKCSCCGETVRVFLALDHVNGGGHQHVKHNASGHYRDAIKRNFPSDYQILCYNCNWAKYFLGACPHQTDPVLKAQIIESGACVVPIN